MLLPPCLYEILHDVVGGVPKSITVVLQLLRSENGPEIVTFNDREHYNEESEKLLTPDTRSLA